MSSSGLMLSSAKLAALLAFVICAGSGSWVFMQRGRFNEIHGLAERPVLAGGNHISVMLRPQAEAGASWLQPPAQSQGGGWIYEVFTPPVIFYNAAVRSFAVTPPRYGNEATESVFGWELVAVRRELFRLQLTGYFSAPDGYLVAFVSPVLPETFLARPGRHFAELALTLRSFEVRKVQLKTDAPGPVYDVAAVAVLRDERNGDEVTLDSRSRKLTDTPLAVFRSADGKGGERALREGEIFANDGATYRVERIQLEPAEVVVVRSQPGIPVPEIRVLRPANVVAAAEKNHLHSLTSPERAVATSQP